MAKKSRISKKEIESLVEEDLRASLKEEILLPADFKFRSSRLPFCKREYVIHNRFDRERTVLRSEDYKFNFYVKIGSAVHEVVQQFLGMANFLYGNWTCCGITEYGREGSAICPLCGRPQKYDELAPNSELGMHVDGVNIKWKAVVEFKTTSSSNLESLKKPYDKHIVQASCYSCALNESYDWGIDKIIFVYLSRDNPEKFKVFVVKPSLEAYPEALELYKQAQEDLADGRIPDGICVNAAEGHKSGCSYAGICFSPALSSHLVPVSSLIRDKHEIHKSNQ